MAQVTSGIVKSNTMWYSTFYVSWNRTSYSVENNSSTISWEAGLITTNNVYWLNNAIKINSVYINGSLVLSNKTYSNITTNGTHKLASGTTVISHNSNGEKSFGVSISGWLYDTGSPSGSSTFELVTIPRASKITSFTGNSIDSYLYVRYTYYDSSFTNKIRISIPSVKVLEYATTTSFKLSDETLNYIYSYTTNSKTITLGAVVETWSGNTKVGESEELTLTLPITGNPTVGTFTYADTNSHTTNITKDNQIIIRNSSNLVFTIGTATPKKSATISKYEVTFNGITKSRTSAGTLDFGTINLANNDTAKLSVIDSRGNTSTKNITIKIEDWVLPSGLIDAKRKNNFYSETYVTVDGTISSLNGKNSMSIVCQYKKVSDTTYTSISLEDNIQKVLELDNNFQWNIVVTISDKIGSTTYNLILDRGMPLIFYDRIKSSVGINCFPTKEKSIEIDGDANANNMAIAGSKEIDNFDKINTGEELNQSGLYSVNLNNNWYNLINIRHRNGKEDGTNYGMQIRTLMSGNSQKLQIRQQANGVWGKWRYIQEEPVVLYNGVDAGGTLEEITLSESATNFSYIEIFATKDEASGIWSVKTPSPNGRTVQVGTSYYAGSAYQTIGKTVKIQANKITHNTEFYINFNTSTGAIAGIGGQNTVKILKVIGYR